MRSQLTAGVLTLFVCTAMRAGPQLYTRLLESPPVQVNGAEFVAVTEAEWVAFNPPHGRDPIEVQLHITNRSAKDMAFPTCDTFGIVIKTADGKEIRRDGGRDHVLRGNKPVLIPPGGSYCLCKQAHLHWTDTTTRKFVYQDGTGSIFTYGPLPSGKYVLSFWYANTQEHAAVLSKAMSNVPVWSGKAMTKEVSFEVVDP